MRKMNLLVGCFLALGAYSFAAPPSEHIERLCREGRHAEAEAVAEKALASHRQRNPRHHDCAATLHNLALVYVAQGRCSEAERLYKQALAIDEETFATGHADTATTLSHFATLCREQERFEEAETMLLRALAIRERSHGAHHRWTAAVLINLAMTYDRQGRSDDAARIRDRAMAILERSFEAPHSRLDKQAEPVPVFRREQLAAE